MRPLRSAAQRMATASFASGLRVAAGRGRRCWPAAARLALMTAGSAQARPLGEGEHRLQARGGRRWLGLAQGVALLLRVGPARGSTWVVRGQGRRGAASRREDLGALTSSLAARRRSLLGFAAGAGASCNRRMGGEFADGALLRPSATAGSSAARRRDAAGSPPTAEGWGLQRWPATAEAWRGRIVGGRSAPCPGTLPRPGGHQ